MDRRRGTQAQQRDAQEGFLEEGSPPPKLEEHTVQTGGGAPSGCEEEVRCVQLLVPRRLWRPLPWGGVRRGRANGGDRGRECGQEG